MKILRSINKHSHHNCSWLISFLRESTKSRFLANQLGLRLLAVPVAGYSLTYDFGPNVPTHSIADVQSKSMPYPLVGKLRIAAMGGWDGRWQRGQLLNWHQGFALGLALPIARKKLRQR